MNTQYRDEIVKRINIIDEDKAIDQAAFKIAEAYENGKKTYTFGTGHSHMLGEELYSRAGGWDYIVPMLLDELTLSSHPFKSTYIERVPGFSDVLLKMFPLSKGDVIIITSNSGRNPLIIEMALKAREIGAIVIAVTSLQHSNSIESRHESGKLLFQLADIVLDNLAPSGDAIINITDKNKTGPLSTMTDVFIGNKLVIEAIKTLESKGVKYNLLISSNLDNQDSRNESLMDK